MLKYYYFSSYVTHLSHRVSKTLNLKDPIFQNPRFYYHIIMINIINNYQLKYYDFSIYIIT